MQVAARVIAAETHVADRAAVGLEGFGQRLRAIEVFTGQPATGLGVALASLAPTVVAVLARVGVHLRLMVHLALVDPEGRAHGLVSLRLREESLEALGRFLLRLPLLTPPLCGEAVGQVEQMVDLPHAVGDAGFHGKGSGA